MTVFFTSDTHYSHSRILKYCNRPFENVEAMNEELIRRWNERVGGNDDVWHLGDFGWKTAEIPSIVKRLNGRIHLVHGNHDDQMARGLSCWASSQPYAEIKVDNGIGGHDAVCLFHYACRCWNGSHHGSYQLFGHTHANLDPINRSIDVGVDAWDYYPVTIAQIKERLAELGLNEKPKFPKRQNEAV